MNSKDAPIPTCVWKGGGGAWYYGCRTCTTGGVCNYTYFYGIVNNAEISLLFAKGRPWQLDEWRMSHRNMNSLHSTGWVHGGASNMRYFKYILPDVSHLYYQLYKQYPGGLKLHIDRLLFWKKCVCTSLFCPSDQKVLQKNPVWAFY